MISKKIKIILIFLLIISYINASSIKDECYNKTYCEIISPTDSIQKFELFNTHPIDQNFKNNTLIFQKCHNDKILNLTITTLFSHPKNEDEGSKFIIKDSNKKLYYEGNGCCNNIPPTEEFKTNYCESRECHGLEFFRSQNHCGYSFIYKDNIKYKYNSYCKKKDYKGYQCSIYKTCDLVINNKHKQILTQKTFPVNSYVVNYQLTQPNKVCFDDLDKCFNVAFSQSNADSQVYDPLELPIKKNDNILVSNSGKNKNVIYFTPGFDIYESEIRYSLQFICNDDSKCGDGKSNGFSHFITGLWGTYEYTRTLYNSISLSTNHKVEITQIFDNYYTHQDNTIKVERDINYYITIKCTHPYSLKYKKFYKHSYVQHFDCKQYLTNGNYYGEDNFTNIKLRNDGMFNMYPPTSVSSYRNPDDNIGPYLSGEAQRRTMQIFFMYSNSWSPENKVIISPVQYKQGNVLYERNKEFQNNNIENGNILSEEPIEFTFINGHEYGESVVKGTYQCVPPQIIVQSTTKSMNEVINDNTDTLFNKKYNYISPFYNEVFTFYNRFYSDPDKMIPAREGTIIYNNNTNTLTGYKIDQEIVYSFTRVNSDNLNNKKICIISRFKHTAKQTNDIYAINQVYDHPVWDGTTLNTTSYYPHVILFMKGIWQRGYSICGSLHETGMFHIYYEKVDNEMIRKCKRLDITVENGQLYDMIQCYDTEKNIYSMIVRNNKNNKTDSFHLESSINFDAIYEIMNRITGWYEDTSFSFEYFRILSFDYNKKKKDNDINEITNNNFKKINNNISNFTNITHNNQENKFDHNINNGNIVSYPEIRCNNNRTITFIVQKRNPRVDIFINRNYTYPCFKESISNNALEQITWRYNDCNNIITKENDNGIKSDATVYVQSPTNTIAYTFSCQWGSEFHHQLKDLKETEIENINLGVKKYIISTYAYWKDQWGKYLSKGDTVQENTNLYLCVECENNEETCNKKIVLRNIFLKEDGNTALDGNNRVLPSPIIFEKQFSPGWEHLEINTNCIQYIPAKIGLKTVDIYGFVCFDDQKNCDEFKTESYQKRNRLLRRLNEDNNNNYKIEKSLKFPKIKKNTTINNKDNYKKENKNITININNKDNYKKENKNRLSLSENAILYICIAIIVISCTCACTYCCKDLIKMLIRKYSHGLTAENMENLANRNGNIELPIRQPNNQNLNIINEYIANNNDNNNNND